MSRLTRMFSKRRFRADDSASEADEGLVSDTAENETLRDSDVSEGHSGTDWLDWSVNDSSKDEGDEELVPLKDGEEVLGGSQTSLSRSPRPMSRRLMSENDLGKLKDLNKSRKKKKKKSKEKSKSIAEEASHPDDISDTASKKKKKRGAWHIHPSGS